MILDDEATGVIEREDSSLSSLSLLSMYALFFPLNKISAHYNQASKFEKRTLQPLRAAFLAWT